MAEEKPTITITINKNIENALKEGYEYYLKKAKEPVLTVEKYNLHILKLGILSNEIKKKELEVQDKKENYSKAKSDLAILENEFRENRIKIGTAYSFEKSF